MGMKVIDITGQRFGMVVVVSLHSTQGRDKPARWNCRCDCGVQFTTNSSTLRQGRTKSCGCARRDRVSQVKFVHGESSWNGGDTPEYRAWRGLIGRCENEKNPRFYLYGGRGISVCARWRRDFGAFLSDVGRRPSASHSLDRFPNQDGNYEPGNVRWATSVEQSRNRRTVRLKDINGVPLGWAGAAQYLAMPHSSLRLFFRRAGVI